MSEAKTASVSEWLASAPPYTPDPKTASVCSHPCMKCSPGLDVAVSYHPRRSYCDPHSRFTFNSRDDEHLHYTCRNCGYDWTGDVADAA